jgi:hypothetical protein
MLVDKALQLALTQQTPFASLADSATNRVGAIHRRDVLERSRQPDDQNTPLPGPVDYGYICEMQLERR